VICNSVLHHMPDPSPLWHEIKRLAAPNGLIFVRDLRRPESDEVAKQLVQQHAANEPPLLQEEFHRSLLAAFTPDEIRKQLDAAVILALGGDGTLLSAARRLGGRTIPLMGVNFGRLGFLASFAPDHFRDDFEALVAGQLPVSSRLMLEASVVDAKSDCRLKDP